MLQTLGLSLYALLNLTIIRYFKLSFTIISQFETNFDQFVLDGDEFIANDKNVLFMEMMSGIILEAPDSAICKYAEQKNHIIINGNMFT